MHLTTDLFKDKTSLFQRNLCFVSDPDGSVKVLHHTPVVEYRFSVVSGQVCGGNLHLTLFEKDLDHDVHQETILPLMQTRREREEKKL